jgi:hypothetical protein
MGNVVHPAEKLGAFTLVEQVGRDEFSSWYRAGSPPRNRYNLAIGEACEESNSRMTDQSGRSSH